MKMLKAALAFLSLAVVASPFYNGLMNVSAGPSVPVLKADYQFQGNLNSSVGTAPALTSLTGSGGPTSFVNDTVDGFTRQTLRFPMNSGVAIGDLTAIVPQNSFTVAILFKLDDMSGMRRFFDVSGGTSADGFFFLNGRLEPESTANLAMLSNAYSQIVVVRTGMGQVHYYRDGILRFTDADDGMPLPNGIRFFQDAVNNPLLASPGNVARIRLWDVPMTVEQVNALDRVPETPFGDMPVTFLSNRNGALIEQYRMNADGTSQVRLTNNQFNDVSAKFSPDGTKLLYQRRQAVASDPLQIWIMNADGSNQTRVTNTTTNDISPAWRPDGQKIIFSRCDANLVCDLYTMNPDGSEQQPITAANTAQNEDQAKFTPNGQKIVFVCQDASANFQICVTNADGTDRQLITNTVAPLVSQLVEISPDSQKLVFVRNSTTVMGTAGEDIYTMNIDGSNLVNLTNNATRDTTPMWSPDGTKIMFSAQRAGGIQDIWIMNADGSNPIRIMRNSADDRLSDWYRPPVQNISVPFDYDGDGKSDVSVWRPSNGTWYVARSGLNDMYVQPWGLTGDVIVPADYDGDGKTDLAVRRPSDNNFYVFNSSNATVEVRNFGLAGDVAVPSDYNGDGKADVAVWRPSNGTWYLSLSGSGIFYVMPWGLATDKPVPGDFDGDGNTELAVFRPSDGKWYRFSTVTGTISVTEWGVNGDRPVQGDYNGDGRTDFAVYRPSNNTWFVQNSNDGAVASTQWGLAGDFPVPGDYDGDGKTDVAVWRPSDATWYVNRSGSGIFTQAFGVNGDTPTPSAFVY